MTSKNTVFPAKKYRFDPIYSSRHLRYLERKILNGISDHSFLKGIKMDYHELLVLVLFVALIALVAGFQGAIGR